MNSTHELASTPGLSFPSGSSVLLRAPALDSEAQCVCSHIGERDGNLLVVSLSGNPDRRLDAWRRGGGLPEMVAVISADGTRSVSAETETTTQSVDGTAISTTTVSAPDDLTGLGIKTNQCLSAWEGTNSETHLCFDSLTTLLQYVETRRAFRYLDVMVKRIRDTGATAHYHIDPTAHDRQTLTTIECLFSDIVEYDSDEGIWSRVQ